MHGKEMEAELQREKVVRTVPLCVYGADTAQVESHRISCAQSCTSSCVTESSVQCVSCCVFASLTSPVTRKNLAWGLYSSHGFCWNVDAHGGVSFCGLNGRWGDAVMPAPIPSLAGHVPVPACHCCVAGTCSLLTLV